MNEHEVSFFWFVFLVLVLFVILWLFVGMPLFEFFRAFRLQ